MLLVQPELPVSCLWPSNTTCNLVNKLRHHRNQCFQQTSSIHLGFSACLTYRKSPVEWHWWEEVPVELKRQEQKGKKKARCLLNSKVEPALEVENPEKPFPGSCNSIVASWENFKLFSLVSQILHYQVPTFISSFLIKLFESSTPSIIID